MLKTLLHYGPVQIASALSIFVLIALQTRYLGIEEYGVLSVYLVLVEITRSIYSQWLNTTLIRHYPGANNADKETYASIVFSGIVGLFLPISLIFTLVLFTFFSNASLSILAALLGLLITKSFFIFFQEMARLNERVTQYRKTTATQSILAMVLTWLTLEYSPSVVAAILGLTLSYLISLPFVWFLPSLASLSLKKTAVSKLVNYGWPLMLSGLIGVAGSRIDRFFIAEQLSYADAGIYSALSNMLLGLMALVFMVVALPLYPDLARKADDKKQLFKAHQKYQLMMFSISLPALVGLCFIAEPLISLFLSEDFLSTGVSLFWILAASAFVSNLRMHYVDHGLQFASKTKVLPFILFTSLSLNLIILFALLPSLGIYGAAYASLICNIVALLLSFILAKRAGHEYWLNIDMVKIIIAVGNMALALYLIQKVTFWPLSEALQIILSMAVAIPTFYLSALAMNLMGTRNSIKNKIRKNDA
ncbi:oligosaccharide flippase family protein [uncultured Aliivibrio sp.]|uniref:oligosaccharide flippase family protein n=1 Tax=uncultured Aliivibrio sp. TaxID=873085 RepID=UPI0026221B43|nr:oligosaccharide flippase family protein [uncultured Aliivibrio sp.]